MSEVKEKILDLVSDLVTDLLYYDRKECSWFKVGDIEKHIKDETITIDDIVNHFRNELEKHD